MNNSYMFYDFVFNSNDDYDPTFVNPDQYHVETANLGFYFDKTESDQRYQPLGSYLITKDDIVNQLGYTPLADTDFTNYYSKTDSNNLFLTGITSSQVINSLGYTPLSGYTGTQLSDYHINVSDTLFDTKYLPIGAQSTINSLTTTSTSNTSRITNIESAEISQNNSINNLYTISTNNSNDISDIQSDYTNLFSIAQSQSTALNNLEGDMLTLQNDAVDSSLNLTFNNFNGISITGSTQDLSANRSWSIGLSKIGVAGTYNRLTVDDYGRISFAETIAYLTSITSNQVTSALGYTPLNTSIFDSFYSTAVLNTRNITVNGILNNISVSGGTQNLSTDVNWTIDLAPAGNVGIFNLINTDKYGRVISGQTIPYLTGITSSQVSTALGYTPLAAAEPIVSSGTTLQYYRGDKTFQTLNTDVVPEGNNLYYTDARSKLFGDAYYQLTSLKGQPNGYVGLDATAKINSIFLPSYVDDVLEFANLASMPTTGETGKIYIALDTNFEYRWSGTIYIRLVSSPGTTDALSEGVSNLYFTTARVNAVAPTLTGIGATGTWGINVTGNSATATILQTARTINGISFNGSSNITIADATKQVIVSLTTTGSGISTFNSSTGALNIPIPSTNYEAPITTGTTLQYWRGDKTFQTLNTDAVIEGGNLYTTNNRSLNYVLSGYTGTNTAAIVSTDTFLTAWNKTQGQLNTKASLNSPTLTGIPLAPTASNTTNNTQIATTAFAGNKLVLSANGTGSITTIVIPHGISGLSSTSYLSVMPRNAASANISYATIDATNINIIYSVAPAAGTNNLSYSIETRI